MNGAILVFIEFIGYLVDAFYGDVLERKVTTIICLMGMCLFSFCELALSTVFSEYKYSELL